jgi:gliding motility-associated-like protein
MKNNDFLHKAAKVLATLFILLMSAFQSFGQEICDNGIDDDGDNLVDVFDPDCPCDDQTLLCQPSCEFAIPGGALAFQSQWTSAEIVPIYQTPLVADIDNDDTPEVVIMSSNSLQTGDPRRAKDLLVINGATGVTERTITTPFMAWVGPNPVAIADIDGNGFGEIIIAAMDHPDNALTDRRFLFCYEHDGTLKWKSDAQYGNATTARFGSSIGIADINSDGIAEVYIYNQVFNAQTGVLLVDGGSSGGQSVMTRQAFGDVANPVAANLTNDPGLELACGNTVYNITITNTAGTTGNTITPITIAGKSDGYTSIADIDLDGNLDLIVATEGSTSELYVWNPGNGTPVLIATVNLPNTGGNWIGVPFVGDMDKDCQPEIGVTRSRRVYALDYNGTSTLQNKWTLTTSDASGFTGITMFDFNQDGTQELVYRDESQLRIIDGSGSTPVTIGTNSCGSGTGSEMPVVADVDGDGQAEICVSCQTSSIQLGRLNVFESVGQPWAPCRSVWNQYSYHNVNINNNLSVPIQQQGHQVLLSTITCPFYTCSENRPFNTFLAQSTFLTQEGCPIYPASDLSLTLNNSLCDGSTLFDLSLTITNVSGGQTEDGYPIRFYAGNPFTGTATEIFATGGPVLTTLDLLPAATETINVTLDILSLPKPFNLFVILNDAGNVSPPFAFPLSTLPECNFGDNVASVANINCCPFGDLATGGFTPPSATFCEGGSSNITINATSTAGLASAVYTWTTPTNNTLTGQTIAASENGNYSVVVRDDAQCTVNANINITEIAAPTDAAAGDDQTICEANTALEGNIPSTGTGVWTLISGTGTITNPNSATSTVTGIAIGTSTFGWTITNGGICLSVDTVSITRLAAPSSALAGNDQQICGTSATLSANTPAVGSSTWSVVSGTGTFTDTSAPNSNVSGLSPGINIFQWTISNGVCPVESDQVSITRFADPSSAEAGANQTICAETATLAAETPLVGTGLWTVVSGTGTFADATNPQTTVSGLSIGANVFAFTVSNGTCPSSTDQVTIQRDAAPTTAVAGNDQQVCATTATLTGNSPLVGTGTWSLVAGSGTIVSPNNASSNITGLGAGTNTFAYTITNGTCPASIDQVSIVRDLPPSEAVSGPNQTICADNANLNANVPTVGTGVWSVVSGAATFGDENSAATAVSGLSPGTTVVVWTITNGVCPAEFDQLTIVVDAPVTPPNAGSDQQICAADASLSGNTPITGNGLWTLESGTGTIVNPNSASSAVSGIQIGTSVFRWTITNGTCAAFDEVSITRSDLPSPANAGNNQEICSTTALLDANTPLVGQGTWTVGNGSATFTDANDPDDQVSGLATGVNQLIWTITSGACLASADTVEIDVDENPIQPEAGTDQDVCADNATLSADAAVVGTGVWSIISGNGNINNPASPTSTITNLQAGANVLRWTITNGACVAFDQVTITRSLPPDAALAGDDANICAGETFGLSANIPNIGNGVWTIVSGSGSLSDSTLNNTVLSGTTSGNTVLAWTISNGSCTAETDQITITTNQAPGPVNAGSNQTICSDSTALNAILPTSGTGNWNILSGSGVLADETSNTSPITNLTPGSTVLSWVVSSAGCEPDSAVVTITINTPPTTANAGNDQVICSDTISLLANTPTTGTGSWSVITGNGFFTPTDNPSTSVSGIATGVNVYQWTISSGACLASTDQVIVQRDSVPVNANAGSDLSVCSSDTVTLQAIDAFPGTGEWTVVSGSGTFADINNPNTLVNGLGSGVNVFKWTVTTGNCPPTEDEVTVTNLLPPSAPDAGSDTSICATQIALNANTPTVGTGSWSFATGTGSFSDPSAANAEVSNLNPGANVLVWTISNGTCPPLSDSLTITVSKNPITPNAGPDLSICADTTTLSGAAPSAGTGVWSIVSGVGTIADVNLPNSAVTGIPVGTLVLQWTITSGACIVNDQMSIARAEPPSQAVAGDDLNICDSTITLAATSPTIGAGAWAIVSGSGSFADAGTPNTTLSGIPTGTTVISWTVSSGACAPSVDELTITREAQPDIAAAGDDQNICADTASLQAVPPTTGIGTWTVVSGAGTITDPNNATSSVTGLGVGANVFRWTIAATASCPATFDEVTITRSTAPDEAVAGDDFSVCSGVAVLTANAPGAGTGSWIVVAGNAVVTDPSNPNSPVTGLNTGNNVFEWRITNGSCPDESDQITISRGDTANAGDDQLLCDSTFTLNASAPTAGTGVWTIISGAGTFADSALANTTVTGLNIGPNVFQWTILGGGCPDSTDLVTITRACNTPPVIVNDTLTVDEDSVLVGNVLNNGDIDPDGTTLSVDTVPVAGPTNGTINLNIDGSFTYTPNENFYGADTIVVLVCDSGIPLPALCGNDTIVVNVNPINDPPTIEDDQFAGLQDSVITGNILDNDSDLEGTTFTADTIPLQGATNGIIDIQPDGSFTYTPNPGFIGQDTVVILVCDSGFPLPEVCLPDTLILFVNDTINEPPIITNDTFTVNEDETISGVFLVDDSDPDGTTLVVDTIPLSGPTHGTIDINPDGSFTYTPDSNYYGVDTILINVCDQGLPLPELCGVDTLIINIEPINDPPTIENEFVNTTPGDEVSGNVLDNDSDIEGTTLTADPAVVNGPNNGTFTINEDGNFTYTPNVGFTGIDTIVVLVCDSGFPLPESCLNDTIFITVGAPTFTVDAGPDQTICFFLTTLSGSAPPDSGSGEWTIISGNGTILNPTDSVTQVTALQVGSNTFVWTVTLDGQSLSDTVLITVNEPATPAFAGEDQTACGLNTDLQANSAQAGTGVWTSLNAGASLSNPNNPITAVSGLNLGENQFVWTITNGNCVSIDTVTVTSFAPPQIDAGNDTSICADAQPFTQNISIDGQGTPSWTVLIGNATILGATGLNPEFSDLAAGVNSFLLTVVNGACSVVDTLSITLIDDNSALCGGSDIFIPEGFSPDQDGSNDRFVIYNLNGKTVSIEIYNRWGNLVYENDNYLNDWDGIANRGVILSGENLPESTYYYLIQIEGESEVRKGYLTLWR